MNVHDLRGKRVEEVINPESSVVPIAVLPRIYPLHGSRYSTPVIGTKWA